MNHPLEENIYQEDSNGSSPNESEDLNGSSPNKSEDPNGSSIHSFKNDGERDGGPMTRKELLNELRELISLYEAVETISLFFGAPKERAKQLAFEEITKRGDSTLINSLKRLKTNNKYEIKKRFPPAIVTPDAAAAYLRERVEEIPVSQKGIRASELYEDFCKWFKLRNPDAVSKPSKKKLGHLLGVFKKQKQGGVICYYGIQFKHKNK